MSTSFAGGGAGCGGGEEVSSLSALLEEISFRRRKDGWRNAAGAGGGAADPNLRLQQSTTYWTDLFVRHFLFQSDYEVDGDDLLFFIRRNNACNGSAASHSASTSSATAMKNDAFAVEVFRRDSRKLPIGDPDVDWQETIYLNLIIHQLNYKMTLAVCSRTSPKNLQVLRRYSQKVYATPSRRRQQESKADAEEMTYPYLSFNVDNYEDMFKEVVLRDGESVGVELTASDPAGLFTVVLFTASVPYEAIHRVWESRASLTVRKRLSQTNLFSLFGSGSKYGEQRVEYVRLTGPQGHAELAVTKVKLPYDDPAYSASAYYGGGGCETPASEPGTDLLDQLLDSEDEGEGCGDYPHARQQPPAGSSSVVGFRRGHQRRLSDPSSTLNDFMRLGVFDRAPSNNRSGSTLALNEYSDSFGDAACEIYAGDLLDEFEETKYNPLWTMRGHTQIFHFWRESKRAQSVPLGQYVTYVSLPWWAILREVLDRRTQPLLTF